MTEEKFEQFLKKAAQSYNTPPARAPREQMWQAIEATRKAGPRVLYGGGASFFGGTGGTRFGSRLWLGAAAAAAAVVLVATGVGIGRWSASPDARPSNTAASRATATTGVVGTDAPGTAAPSEPALIAGSDRRAKGSGGDDRTSPASRGPAPNGVTLPGPALPSPYQVAAVNHLSEAEALLTSLKTRSAADQQLDAQLATWARELLIRTRLLLASPVAADIQRRPLLQDLELLLVQIVQLSPGSTPQDREIIEETLQQEQVLIRLRTAIPAGQRGG